MKLKLSSQLVKSLIISFTIVIAAISPSIAQRKKIFSKEQYIELTRLRAAVEANPNNLQKHVTFISEWGVSDSTLASQYKRWVKRYPKSFVVPFVIGKSYVNAENPLAREFLLRAVAINPNMAEIWELLGEDAALRDDENSECEYFGKATEIEPSNSDYAFAYAYFFHQSNPDLYHSLSFDFLKRFKDNKYDNQVLDCLAQNTTSTNERIAYYEMLFNDHSTKRDIWFYSAMTYYYHLVLGTDAVKAIEIAKILKDASKIKLANQFLQVTKLLQDNKPLEAASIVGNVKLIEENEMMSETLELLKAKVADACGNTLVAYNGLSSLYSKTPTDTLHSAILVYSQKLGLTQMQVSANIKRLRDSTAQQATNFTLEGYLASGKVSLSDFRGKVVLLTYWFPGCGPCRGEFPYFESVLKKINNKDVVYLGLNLQESQNSLVVPFLKSSGCSFTPLHDDWHREKGNLVANGAPTNYLIDQNGRIIFKDFRINQDNERTLELMISELLQYDNNTILVDSTQMKEN